MEFVAFSRAHAEAGIRAGFGRHRLVQQHLRQLRHPLAMAAGIGALGIDGIGQQLDHGIQQALLGFDQLARLDGHRCHPGQLRNKAAKRLAGLLVCRSIAQLQDQDAQQRLATVIQHQGQAVLGQAEGLGHRRGEVLLGSLIHGQLARVLLATAGRGQAQQGVFGIEQVNHASVGPGGFHQMGQHTVEHALQVALAAEREGNRLEAADGARHAAKHAAQLTHLGHPRAHPDFAAEIKAGQALHLFSQQPQRATDAPTNHTTEHQQHANQDGGPEQLFEQYLARTGQQLLAWHGDQHLQVLAGQVGQLHTHAIPGLAIHLIRVRPGALRQVCVKVLQAGNTQFADARQAHGLPFVHDDPLQVRVGHHAALVVDHDDLGAGGHAQALRLADQVVDRNVHANHRTAVDAALGHGQADLAGGEEHIGVGQHGGGLGAGFDKPRARTRIVAVFGLGPGLQQVQRVVVEAPLTLHRPTLTADALHQKCRPRRCGETLQHLRVTQAAHQQEITTGVTHVGGTEHAVGVQRLDQLRQAFQALRRGLRGWVVGEQADTALHRVDQAPGAFVDGLANLLGRITRCGHQGLTNAVITLPGQGGAEQQHAQHDGECHQPL